MQRQARNAIYEAAENKLRGLGINGLALKSAKQVHPCWVKVECWIPFDDPLVTERVSATVTIEPKPFHKFDLEYNLEYDDRGKHKTVPAMFQFGAQEVLKLMEFLLGSGDKVSFGALQLRAIAGSFGNQKTR